MHKRLGYACSLTGLLLFAVLSGCAAMRNGTIAPASSELVGQWRRVSIATINQSVNCPATLSLPGGFKTSCGDNDVIEFHSDGSFTATLSGSPVKGAGTWRLEGNNLVLTFTAPAAASGSTHSTTVTFAEGGRTINISATLIGASTTETYTRL